MKSNKLLELLKEKDCLRVLEAVNGLEAMIAENAGNGEKSFDALWLSGFCHAAHKGMPDDGKMPVQFKIEALDEIAAVSRLPVIVDCDTGGTASETAETAQKIGNRAKALVIEDKRGAKRNSLYGKSVNQEMEAAEIFSEKLLGAKKAASAYGTLVFARLESLIAGETMETAAKRAEMYIAAGADGIVLHSVDKSGSDIFRLAEIIRRKNGEIPIIMIPTVYNTYTFEELRNRGANIVIYANQLTRSAYKAMKKTAESILSSGNSRYADENYCVPARELLKAIEGEIND